MKRLYFLGCMIFVLTGCAHHYYRLDDTTVKIFLKAPDAGEVLFASSLDGYAPHPAVKTDNKTWVISLPADKQFTYFYLIDGELYIPECTYREYDDFGSNNCVFIPGM